jgi:hypothetical protein
MEKLKRHSKAPTVDQLTCILKHTEKREHFRKFVETEFCGENVQVNYLFTIILILVVLGGGGII